jgi:hypothetical protein
MWHGTRQHVPPKTILGHPATDWDKIRHQILSQTKATKATMGRPFLRVCHATFAQRQLDLDWSAQFHLEYVWNTIGKFLPKPLQRLVLRLFSHVLLGPYSVWTDSDEQGRAKKRNPNLRGKNPRPRSSKSWHNEWNSELAMFWARAMNNRKRWSWLTLLEWAIWTHRRRKKRQGLALKILQKSTNIPEKTVYASLEEIIDFIFQISVGMPRNAEIDEILNSLNIFTYWKVRRYLHPKSKARKKMSRMRYLFFPDLYPITKRLKNVLAGMSTKKHVHHVVIMVLESHGV